MPLFLNTRGNSSLAVGICGRCKMKRAIGELTSDGNIPGLIVCKDRGCSDQFDPWRLPTRAPDKIQVRHPRPDEPLIVPVDP